MDLKASIGMSSSRTSFRWIFEITAKQWLVVGIASAAWFFDTLDQRLFSLARVYALASLLGLAPGDLAVQSAAKLATSIMLLGWGVGGLASGGLGDRYGHAKILTASILLYSIGSALSAVSQTVETFMVYRFFTGAGIGGIFGLAVALIADSTKGQARLVFLASLQVVASIANMSSPFIKMGVDALVASDRLAHETWRVLFAISAVPMLLGVASAIWLRETEAWRQRQTAGTLPKGAVRGLWDMARHPREGRHLLIATVLAVAGVVGLWGIGEFATDLQTSVFADYYAQRVSQGQVMAAVAQAKNWAFLLQMAGGTIGIVVFGLAANRFGRRPTFILWFLAAFVVTALAYWKMATPMDAYWMMPLMGAAQLGLFGGYAIYLPELFSAATRGMGVSFAYNLGRFAAAAGGLGSAWLTDVVFARFASPLPLRYAAMSMCAIFLIGALAAVFAPETRGQEFSD